MTQDERLVERLATMSETLWDGEFIRVQVVPLLDEAAARITQLEDALRVALEQAIAANKIAHDRGCSDGCPGCFATENLVIELGRIVQKAALNPEPGEGE